MWILTNECNWYYVCNTNWFQICPSQLLDSISCQSSLLLIIQRIKQKNLLTLRPEKSVWWGNLKRMIICAETNQITDWTTAKLQLRFVALLSHILLSFPPNTPEHKKITNNCSADAALFRTDNWPNGFLNQSFFRLLFILNLKQSRSRVRLKMNHS